MKSNKSVMLGLLIIIVVSFATGCLFYNLLEPKDFKDHFSALGYTISDTEEGKYESKSYLVATKEDMPFKIEYYEFDNDNSAKIAYKKYEKEIPLMISTDSTNNETSGAFMTKMVVKSEKEYIIISRVKNTLIFIQGTTEYENEINTLLDDIKY